MSLTSMTQRAIAVSLACMLVSCSATRHSVSGPAAPQDLSRYALVFEQQPDGEVTHSWIPLEKGRGEWAEEYVAEFETVDPAIDWIKRHHTELAVGAVAVITGVAFAVVVAGSGGSALALAPLLVLAEHPVVAPAERQTLEARR